MDKVLIIDAFGLIFRAYYALIRKPLSTSEGFPTSAIFGFWKMLFRRLKDLDPEKIVIVFDSPGASFRKEIYPEYKANRQETPEDLKEQIAYIVNMVKRVNLPYLMKEGLEADDIIAYLAKKFEEEGDEVYILSSDKDLSQLVHARVKMALPEKGIQELKILDERGVEEKFGVKPAQMRDYLALVGDTSDNVPGVKGIGPKTAVKLLSDYSSLDGIYMNIDQISGSLKTKLEKNRDSAYLSLKLVELYGELPQLSFRSEDFNFSAQAFARMGEDFRKLEFFSLLEDEYYRKSLTKTVVSAEEDSPFIPLTPTESQKTETDYRLVLKKSELEEILDRCSRQGWLAIDTETTSEVPLKAQIIGISLALREGEAFYFPLFEGCGAEYSREDFFKRMKPLLESESIGKIGQNIKYDYQILRPYARLRGIIFDTMIAAYLLDPDEKKYNMDYLAAKYLNGYQTTIYKDIVPQNGTLLDVPLEQVKNYACEDADITLRLYRVLESLLKKQDVLKIFKELELPFIPVLAEMELAGIPLNLEALKTLQVDLENRIALLEEKIYGLSGIKFNLNSPKQIGEILFEKMNIPVIRRTKMGYSTDEQVLEQLKDYEIVGYLLEYRKYSKLLSTYVQTLPRYLIRGRIHTSFHQTGTATGRLSSSDPNLQNIPVRDEIGNSIRKAFTAPEGFRLISADYSQIELRLMAHFSGDPNLIQAFREERDIHRSTASKVFDIPESQVTDFQRHVAKSINFGIIYGMGPFKLSKEMDISISEARQFIKRYFTVFSKVREYIEKVKEESRKNGYVQTLFGHRRYLPYIRSRNRNLREADERIAVNSLIQGTNADILKKTMIDITPGLEKFQARMLLQIHDELVFEVPQPRESSFLEWLKTQMEHTISLAVPLKISLCSGSNWGELK